MRIARAVGVSHGLVHKWDAWDYRIPAPDLPARPVRVSQIDVDRAIIAAHMKNMPADTRPLTARTFGDPLPGRSALDRRGTRNG